MVKDGLTLILNQEDKLYVSGSLDNGHDVMPFLQENKVHLVILDLNLPGIKGVVLARQIKEKYPMVKVMALTFYNKAAFIKEIAESGCEGYLVKNSSKEEVIEAIFKILNGEKYFSQEVSETMFNSLERSGTKEKVKLTKREIEVMVYLAKGYTVNEIAEKLIRSPHTVDTHRKNIMGKLGFRNRAALALYAQENGYLDLDE